MDTTEHTDVGNAIRFTYLNNNPYLRTDEQGVLHLFLQRFTKNNIPRPMALEMSAGEIVAMAGDYFTEEDWSMDLGLPKYAEFENSVELGQYLIQKPIEAKESRALKTAYNNLAASDVSRKEIDQIYRINDTNYIPFSPILNFYFQQILFTLLVKDYGEMLIRNQTHFTPWSVRVYILGHEIALHYARLSYELHQLAQNPDYPSQNHKVDLVDLAHRYHAQAYAMELYTFHYYSDHFAAGHMSMVGDLRVLLPQRFGTWGNILVNSFHDELNRIGIFSSNPYDFLDKTEAPSCARGDGDFDSGVNAFNRGECITGMTSSIEELDKVLQGAPIPYQADYAGIKYMRDVDLNCRQIQPLLVQVNEKIYQRSNLRQVKILSPSEYDALRDNPEAHGYHEVKNSWDAFILVVKIRLFPYLYEGKLVPLSDDKLDAIKAEERLRKPERNPIPDPLYVSEAEVNIQNWRIKSDPSFANGLRHNGLFSNKVVVTREEDICLVDDERLVI